MHNIRNRFNTNLVALLERIFTLVFKEKASDKVKKFVENFSYIAFAEIIGSLIGFPVKILVGRYLGPVEYGKYSLILSFAQFLLLPMLVGFGTAAVRYLPLYREKAKEIIGVIHGFFLITWIISVIFFIITRYWWIKIFDVPMELFWWALVYGIILALYTLYEAINRGMHRFKFFAYTSLANSVILLVVFLVMLFWFNIHTYEAFMITVLCALLVTLCILAYPIFKQGVTLTLKNEFSVDILKYSGLAILGGVTGFFIANINNFFLNHYVSLYWVGVYAAYTNGSMIIVGKFFQIFVNVYFPTVSGEKDKYKVDRLVKKILKIGTVPVFIISFISIWGVLWLFGNKFPISFGLIALFSINNCFYVYQQFYMWLLNSQGRRGFTSTVKISMIAAVLNIGLMFALIQPLGVTGVIITTIIINMIFAVYFKLKTDHFFKENYFYENTD